MVKETYKIIMRKGLLTEEAIGEVFYNYIKSAGVNHIEFRGRAISETGYYSHFFYPADLKDRTIEQYLTEFLNATCDSQVENIIKIAEEKITSEETEEGV